MDITNIVSIPLWRYEQLIKAETILNAVCGKIAEDEPYNLKSYQAIVGKDRLPDHPKEDAEEGEDE